MAEVVRRGESIHGGIAHVYVEWTEDWPEPHEPDDPGPIPVYETPGFYVALGRPWSDWRLRHARRVVDRRVARRQRALQHGRRVR